MVMPEVQVEVRREKTRWDDWVEETFEA